MIASSVPFHFKFHLVNAFYILTNKNSFLKMLLYLSGSLLFLSVKVLSQLTTLPFLANELSLIQNSPSASEQFDLNEVLEVGTISKSNQSRAILGKRIWDSDWEFRLLVQKVQVGETTQCIKATSTTHQPWSPEFRCPEPMKKALSSAMTSKPSKPLTR